jgi:hypothetical protein
MLSVEGAIQRPSTGGHLVASAAATVRVHAARMRPKGRISSSNRPGYGNYYQFDQRKHLGLSRNSASHAEGRWFDPSRDHTIFTRKCASTPRWGTAGHAGCRHRGESGESDERRAAQSTPTPTKTPDAPSVLVSGTSESLWDTGKRLESDWGSSGRRYKSWQPDRVSPTAGQRYLFHAAMGSRSSNYVVNYALSVARPWR